jgi:NTE family protein
MPAERPTVRTAIVLQGGGALGAYELGVLQALYETRPGFRPAVVAGTSIGAITAAVLGGARGDPIATLKRLWREKLALPGLGPLGFACPPQFERTLSVFGNPGMYRPRTDHLYAPWLRTSIYDTTPLRTTLSELVDLDKLNDGTTRVIFGAIDVETAESRFFDSHNERLTFDHVVASGSLPPGFPMTEVLDPDRSGQPHWYWDGGLFTNTPLSPAINGLEQSGAGDSAAQRELIVVELFPMEGTIPGSMPDVFERMVELQYASRLKLDRRFFDKVDQMVNLIDRIEAELPPDSPIRQDPSYLQLRRSRKIDRFMVVTAKLGSELRSASDFSRASIEARIEAGHRDALDQGIAGPARTEVQPAATAARRQTAVASRQRS